MTKEDKKFLKLFLSDKFLHSGDEALVLYNDYFSNTEDYIRGLGIFYSGILKNTEKEIEHYFGKDIRGFVKMLNSFGCAYNIDDPYFIRNQYGNFVSSDNIADLIDEFTDLDALLDRMVDAYEKDGDFTLEKKIIDSQFPAFKKKMKSKEKDAFAK